MQDDFAFADNEQIDLINCIMYKVSGKYMLKWNYFLSEQDKLKKGTSLKIKKLLKQTTTAKR